MKYNTVGYLGFTVDHNEKLPSLRYIESSNVRMAILNRLDSMTDSELYSEIDWGETIDNE